MSYSPPLIRLLAGALLLGSTLLCGCNCTTLYNLDFEDTDYRNHPSKWSLPDSVYYGYAAASDRNCRKHGGYSLRLEQVDTTKYTWARFSQELPDTLVAGHEIELSGWVRTEEVTEGFADLFLILTETEDDDLLAADTAGRGLRGTTEWQRMVLRQQIPDSASGVRFGGLLKGGGRVWFDRFEIRIDGRKLRDPRIPVPKSRLTRCEKAELRRYIHPLSGCDATDADSVDLRSFDTLIGHSQVVALGENSHGASEIFRMKERLIRHLATRQGFDQVVFEADMAAGIPLDNYLRNGQGTAIAALFGLEMWIWDTHEVLSLIEWMRQRNVDGHPIHFRGIDMQSANQAVKLLRQEAGKDAATRQLLDEIAPKLDSVLSYDRRNRARIDSLAASEIERNLNRIESRIDRSATDARSCTLQRQLVTLIRQYLGLDEGVYWRDRCMAENLLWIRQQNPDSRMVIWGHNGHVSRAENRMGRHLEEALGADYLNVGFTFHAGRCSIIVPGSEELQHDVQTAPPGTIEYLLHQLDEPFFVLDLRRLREEQSPALEWINGMKFRHIGALRWEDEFWDEGLADQFDLLIYIDRVTPSQLLF